MADVLYFALRIRQMNDGVVSWGLSSAQEDLNAAKALVCDRVSSDRKNNAVVFATNLCIGSDGSILLKNYFTHDLSLEVPAYAAIEITQYTEEAAKPVYKAISDFATEYDAETEYWTRRGNVYKDNTIDTALNIVLNWHGGVEASDYWMQYPESTTYVQIVDVDAVAEAGVTYYILVDGEYIEDTGVKVGDRVYGKYVTATTEA